MFGSGTLALVSTVEGTVLGTTEVAGRSVGS